MTKIMVDVAFKYLLMNDFSEIFKLKTVKIRENTVIFFRIVVSQVNVFLCSPSTEHFLVLHLKAFSLLIK